MVISRSSHHFIVGWSEHEDHQFRRRQSIRETQLPGELQPGDLNIPRYRLEDPPYTNKLAGMCPDKISYTRARGHDLEMVLPSEVNYMPDQLLTQLFIVIIG